MRISEAFILLLTSVFLYTCFICLKEDSVYTRTQNLQKLNFYDELPESAAKEVNILKRKINEINLKREVRNWEKFGPLIKETVIVTVQVHRDIRGLQHLITSLAQVRHVGSVLLVFSHSYYSDGINQVILSIDFCKVMQIYYPHSVQLHPDKFPGRDPEHCTNGSQTTLNYCQQRDAGSTERKHHWWWTANFVFDQMEWSLSYMGTVIFLEEHQYVAPDLLYMLRFLQRSLSSFPDVEVMSLGKLYKTNLDPHLLTLENWKPPFDVGVAFNKTTWNKIVELSSYYCTYDDCSWSHSLLHLFKHFPKGEVAMLSCVAPRVISMKQFDNAHRTLLQASQIFSNLRLFPEKVEAVFVFGPSGRMYFSARAPPKGNGCWSNVKDHLLCLDPTAAADDYEATTSRFDQYSDQSNQIK